MPGGSIGFRVLELRCVAWVLGLILLVCARLIIANHSVLETFFETWTFRDGAELSSTNCRSALFFLE